MRAKMRDALRRLCTWAATGMQAYGETVYPYAKAGGRFYAPALPF